MKTEVTLKREIELKTLNVHAGVRYWEDAEVNGVEDESGDMIPCRIGDSWEPIIDIDSGIIINWNQGVKAKIHYKVCDCCGWDLLDENGDVVLSEKNDYVPKTLYPAKNGYGDYIIMNIDENGKIENWNFNIEDFQDIDN